MSQEDQGVKRAERDRRDDHKIDRGDPVSMIAQKRLPALRRRSSVSRHILGHGRLANIYAELQEFPMYPRCSPQRIREAHVSYELADLRRYLRPPTRRS